jgi:hypothetical protein
VDSVEAAKKMLKKEDLVLLNQRIAGFENGSKASEKGAMIEKEEISKNEKVNEKLQRN